MAKANIALNLFSIGVLAYPGGLDVRLKLAICAIAAIPGAIEVIKHSKKIKLSKDALASLNKENAGLMAKIEAQKYQLTNEREQFEAYVSEVETQIEQQKAEVLQNLQKAVAVQQKYELEGQKILESAKAEAEAEIEEIKVQLYKEYSEKHHELSLKELKLSNDRKQFHQTQQVFMTHIAAEKERLQSEFNTWKQQEEEQLASRKNLMYRDIQNYRDRVTADLEAQKIASESEINLAYAQLEADQQKWEAERTHQLEEIERLHEIAAIEREQEYAKHQESMQALKKRILDQTEAEIQADIENQIAQVEIEYERKISELTSKNEELSSRLQAAYESLRNTKKPILPKGSDHLSMVARRLILFFHERGVDVDFQNVFEASNAVHVIVTPCDWRYKGNFNKKLFTPHFDAMMIEMCLEGTPQVNISTGQGYDIEFIPKAWPFMGSISPVMMNEPIIKEMLKDIPQTESTPYSLADLKLQKMLGFIEPASAAPKSGPITQLELDWVTYLYEWREKVTQGKSRCIKNQNDLLERIWKTTVGWATDKEIQEDGNTLRGRLHLIFDQLGYPRPRRNNQEEDNA